MAEKIEVACPCGARTMTDRSNAGRKARCPRCGERIQVPGERVKKAKPVLEPPILAPSSAAAESASRIQCVATCECGQRVLESGDKEGQLIACPQCFRWLRLQTLREQRRTWNTLPTVR